MRWNRKFVWCLVALSWGAVASAAAQQTNSGFSTVPVFTSTSEPGSREQIFSGSARWAVGTGPAVEVSNSDAAIINVQTGAIVSSSSATGTIVTMPDSNVTTLTITNTGSIINSSGALAIRANALRSGGGNTETVVNNQGSIIGGISTGNGNDIIRNTGGVMIGGLTLGNGNNTVIINGGAVTGNTSAGSGNDLFDLVNNGLHTGEVNLGNGTNTMNVSNSLVHGNVLTGNSGSNILRLNNAIISGTIDMGAGTNDRLSITGENAFVTRGTITGADEISVTTWNATFNHAVTGGNLTIISSSFVDAQANVTLSGNLQNSGTLGIGPNATVTANTANFNGGGDLLIDVNSASEFGKMVLAGGGMTAASYTINLNGAGYITSGTNMVIVDGATSSVLQAGSLVNSGLQGVHSFNLGLTGGGTDVLLTIQRVSTSSVVSDIGAQNAADVLEVLGNTVTGELDVVQNAVTRATTAGEISTLMESLTPGIDGLGAASVGVVQATGAQVSNRLASLRGGDYGIATGMDYASNYLWLEGFGTSQAQDDKNTGPGFDATSAGVTLGLDSDELLYGANVGMAFSYAQGSVEGKGGNKSMADIGSFVTTLYGSTLYDSGIFVNAQLAAGWNSYELERTVGVGLGKAKATTNGWQASAKGEVGADLILGNMALTPMVGLQATHLTMADYTETGGGNAGLNVSSEGMTALDASAGVRAAYTVALADGSTLRPMIRASVVNRVGDKALNTSSSFKGGGASFKTPGAEAESTALVLGTGLLLATAGGADFTADYDAELRSSSINHLFRLKSRIPF